MKLGYIAFMVASLCIVCAILIGYVNLQSDVTNRITNISKLESELNQLKMDNDEEYTRIMSEVDLDEIKRILERRFISIDNQQAKEDVLPFIQNPESLRIWSKEFFLSTIDSLKS